MQILPGSDDIFVLPPEAFDGVPSKGWDDMQVLPGSGDDVSFLLERIMERTSVSILSSDPDQNLFDGIRDYLDPWA